MKAVFRVDRGRGSEVGRKHGPTTGQHRKLGRLLGGMCCVVVVVGVGIGSSVVIKQRAKVFEHLDVPHPIAEQYVKRRRIPEATASQRNYQVSQPGCSRHEWARKLGRQGHVMITIEEAKWTMSGWSDT